METLWQLAFPLTRPALVTVTIYNALGIWNGFLLPLILTQSPDLRALPLALWTFQGQYGINVPAMLAAVAADDDADPRDLHRRPPPAAQRPHRGLQQVGGSTGERRTQVMPGAPAPGITCVTCSGPRGSAPCLAGPLGVCR